MGSCYSNDDSGFQDIFHIVQNEDEVLAFSLFKKTTRRNSVDNENIPNLHVCTSMGVRLCKISDLIALLRWGIEYIGVMTLKNLSRFLLCVVASTTRGGGWSLTSELLIPGSKYMCSLDRQCSEHLHFQSFRNHSETFWGPSTGGSQSSRRQPGYPCS